MVVLGFHKGIRGSWVARQCRHLGPQKSNTGQSGSRNAGRDRRAEGGNPMNFRQVKMAGTTGLEPAASAVTALRE